MLLCLSVWPVKVVVMCFMKVQNFDRQMRYCMKSTENARIAERNFHWYRLM